MKEKYLAMYSRKSKFTGKGESIKNQIEKCQNYLKMKYGNEYQNIKNNIKIYSDEGYTGYNIKRPKFQKLLSDIEMGIINTIIVYKLDRISRNVTDFCNLKDKFQNQINIFQKNDHNEISLGALSNIATSGFSNVFS